MTRARPLQSQQRGLSMIGFLFVAVVLVKKILATMGQESDIRSKSNAEIRGDFERRANVGYVTVVKPEHLTIDRRGGTPVISADYEFRTKLFGNVSLVVDFSASTNPNAAPAQIE
jgi:hypothetical protein